MNLSQQEVERLCRQSAERSQARRDELGSKSLWWWLGMLTVAVLIWAALVVVAVAWGL